jgi:hypothetical protein
VSNRLFFSAVIGWPLAVLAALASRTAFTASVSTVEYTGWAFLGVVPLAIGLIIARGQSNRSITQVLYDAEHSGDVQKKPATAARG